MQIKVTLSIGLSGCRREDVLEIDESAMDGMSLEEREDYLQETYLQWRDDYLDGGWEVV